MKRLVAVVMVLIVLLTFGGCTLFGYGVDIDLVKPTTEETIVTEAVTDLLTEPPTQEPTLSQDDVLFSDMSGDYIFTSGAGAWATNLTVYRDGTFSGDFRDTDMGSSGEEYIYTKYLCDFSGAFKNVEKINDYSYYVELDYLDYEKDSDTEEIIDGCRYMYSNAYGIYGGDTFCIYTPDTLVRDIPYEFRRWITILLGKTDNEELGCYGIYNIAEQVGFFEDIIP